jgi:glycosyltransferase involved in cell wall biosynthesis
VKPPDLGTRPVWITWERQRRSRELAAALGCDFWEMLSSRPYVLRVMELTLATAWRLLRSRPAIVLVQNPSLLLATWACAWRKVLGYRLVVDRHSSFRLHTRDSRVLKWRVFHALSRYTIRAADLTVVTNAPLRRLVEEWGGRGLVLPDPLPSLSLARRIDLPLGRHAVFVAGHGSDEPLREVVAAAALLPPDVFVHVTGDDRKVAPDIRAAAPANLRFTGFLSEKAYQSLLLSSDVILALTRQPNTLLCAAYEAIALGRPLVLSDHDELAAYFRQGRVLTDGTPKGIAAAVLEALANGQRLAAEVAALQGPLRSEWQQLFTVLVARLRVLVGGREGAGG